MIILGGNADTTTFTSSTGNCIVDACNAIMQMRHETKLHIVKVVRYVSDGDDSITLAKCIKKRGCILITVCVGKDVEVDPVWTDDGG